jgi:GDP-L-fucose synthase
LATEHYDSSEPVNLGAGFEISIRDLADKIKELVGFRGEIRWDTSKPSGQPRRSLDVSRAEEAFGFRASTTFDTGLARTVDWYKRLRSKDPVRCSASGRRREFPDLPQDGF